MMSFAICCLVSSLSFALVDAEHKLFNQVLGDHVADGEVDYAAIKKDERFEKYIASLREVTPSAIKDDNERLAFWINAYNAFTIKLINDHSPISSIRDIKQGDLGPWDIVWIDIHGKRYSLNQIEHEIIRKEFDEPRIHMALVCAAKSCPPLRSEAYVGRTVDAQLEDNSRLFLLDRTKNRYDEKSNALYLSELFNWYGEDFVKRFGSAQNFALRMMGITDVNPAALKYLSYDWSLNGKNSTVD
jgi:hypothetical protein